MQTRNPTETRHEPAICEVYVRDADPEPDKLGTSSATLSSKGRVLRPKFKDGVKNPELADLWSAIVNAGTEARLRSARCSASDRNYLLQPHEVFARAYEQWIVSRAGSDVMKRFVEDVLAGNAKGQVPQWYWDAESFEAISRQFDLLFNPQ